MIINMDSTPTDLPPAAGPRRTGCNVLKVVGLYAAFSALWILLSDHWLGLLVSDPVMLTQASTIKGWAFILITSLLLYFLVLRLVGEIRQADQRHQEILADKLCSYKLLDAIVQGSTDAIYVK